METLESLTKLFVSNKKKIEKLKAENAQAVFDYVSERVKDGEIVCALPGEYYDNGKMYQIQLKCKGDTSFFDCGKYSRAEVSAYPLKKNGEVAKIGLAHLNVDKIEKITKK